PDKGAEIVVYCSNLQCQNSGIAAHRLTALGYTNVAVYRDGKLDWETAGLPLESGKGKVAQTVEGATCVH
ncbi:MAG: rhodanese-like domain-containing protein, partial [Burkholderiales bacterium]